MELNDTIQAEPFSILPDISTPGYGSTVANVNNAKTDKNIDGTNSLNSRLKQLNSCSSPECSLLSMKVFETIKEVIGRSISTPSTCSSDADVAFGRYIGSVLATIPNSQRKETLKMKLMEIISKAKSSEMYEKYTIIKLDDRIELVPTCWLTEDESHCYWPNYSSSSKINSIVEKLAEPDKKSWLLQKVSRIFGTSYDYKVGLEKMKEWVTDVNIARSDGAGSQWKHYRCRKDSTSDESEIEDPASKQDMYILPEPPLKKKTPVLHCFSDGSEQSDTLAESSANISSVRKIPYDSTPSIPVKQASVNNNTVFPLKTSTKTQDKIPNNNVKDTLAESSEDMSSGRKIPYDSTPSIPVKQASVNNNSVFPVKKFSKTHNTIAKGLLEYILQQNPISRLYVLKEHACLSNANSMEIDPAVLTNVMQVFPISTDEQLGKLEYFLSDHRVVKLLVSALKSIGGSGDDQLITNVLKRCVSDRVAELYSWVETKKKKAFKPLIFSSVIFQCVQHHSQTITEETYGAAVSSWLSHAEQRIEQQEKGISL